MPEPLHLNRRIAASASSVFDAWTIPGLMRRWLFTSDQGEIIRVQAEPVVGGRFSILERNDGVEIDHFGTYLVVDRPRRLGFTLEVPQHFSESTEIDVQLVDRSALCELAFTQRGIEASKTRPFWEHMLDELGRTVVGT